MSRMLIVAGLVLAFLAPALAAAAQDSSQVGEFVVTAERRTQQLQNVPVAVSGYAGSTYAPTAQPHVVVFHRADNLISYVQVVCDTREPSARLSELQATFANLFAAAAQSGGTIEFSSEDSGVLVPLKPESIIGLMRPGGRPDTTMVTFIVKTHIGPTDTFEAATARVESFVHKTKLVGRSLVARTGDWELTLITPRQYRSAIVAAIAKDAAETMKPFGPGYAVTLVGLDRPVSWSRSGSLELALFIPYAMTIGPAPGH